MAKKIYMYLKGKKYELNKEQGSQNLYHELGNNIDGGIDQAKLTDLFNKLNAKINVLYKTPRTIDLHNYYSRIPNHRTMTELPYENIYELTNIVVNENASCAFGSQYYEEDGCNNLITIPESLTETWNTSNVTDMSYMFSNCRSLTSMPYYLDTENVTNMKRMFQLCKSLENIPYMDTSKVTDMSRIFISCSKLNSIYDYFDTSNVTDMGGMFCWCESITTIPELDTSKTTSMDFMFNGCKSLPSEFPWVIDCSSITDASSMDYMFRDSSVTKVRLSNVSDSIKPSVTSQLLKKDNTLTIEFV